MYVFDSWREWEWGLWGEWIRGVGFGFTNPVGTGECWTCVCVWVAVVWEFRWGVSEVLSQGM